MNIHTRHVAIAVVVAVILMLLASVVARAQDYSAHSGAKLYERFCASCHGDKGHGDGVVAASFKIEVPDLTRIAKRQGGVFPDEQIRRIIDGRNVLVPHGSREMPVWGYEFITRTKPRPTRRNARKTWFGGLRITCGRYRRSNLREARQD
jgi:mono/diheme cytochrome c family protein